MWLAQAFRDAGWDEKTGHWPGTHGDAGAAASVRSALARAAACLRAWAACARGAFLGRRGRGGSASSGDPAPDEEGAEGEGRVEGGLCPEAL
jgi:hypothetical protein